MSNELPIIGFTKAVVEEYACKCGCGYDVRYNAYGRELTRKFRYIYKHFTPSNGGCNRYSDLKLMLIKAYGGKCECCDETIPEFLTLDHNAVGKKHRAMPDGRKSCGIHLYRYLHVKNFPKYLTVDKRKVKLRLLCANCNTATMRGRTCPHKK